MTKPNRITIDLIHPNTRNAEAFLNSWEEPFIQEEGGTNSFVFCSTISNTKVALSFFDSYTDANDFGTEQYEPASENSMWSVNGGMVFMVSGSDVYKIQSLISHFAGRE